ncbi:MAG: hypothetical protein ACTSRP_00380 [Candidatus Helarchaeota archaeon]
MENKDRNKIKIEDFREQKDFEEVIKSYTVPKDLKYHIFKWIGFSGGILAVISLFFPWYQISGDILFSITPIYLNYGGLTYYFYDYAIVSPEMYPILVMMDISFGFLVLIGILSVYSIFNPSRAIGNLLMILLVLSFFIYPFGIMYGIFNGSGFPIFGLTMTRVYGLSTGWFLALIGFILSLFIRRIKPNKKEKLRMLFHDLIKSVNE